MFIVQDFYLYKTEVGLTVNKAQCICFRKNQTRLVLIDTYIMCYGDVNAII